MIFQTNNRTLKNKMRKIRTEVLQDCAETGSIVQKRELDNEASRQDDYLRHQVKFLRETEGWRIFGRIHIQEIRDELEVYSILDDKTSYQKRWN